MNKEARQLVIAHIESYLPELSGNQSDALEAAYAIAGLLATDFARTLTDDDPISEILTIAGELEINPANANALRDELIQKIKALR